MSNLAPLFAQVRSEIAECCHDCDDGCQRDKTVAALSAIERHVQDMERVIAERGIVMVRGALCYHHGEFDPAEYGCPACKLETSAAEEAAVTVPADAPDDGDVGPQARDSASLAAAEDVSRAALPAREKEEE